MEGADVNGGNVEVAREDPNLDILDTPGSQEEVVSQKSDSGKMDEQEINGDVKIAIKRETTPSARRKLRKFKANSTSTMETDSKPQTRGYKRKLSDPDENSSEESTEFNGFDSQGIEDTDTGSHVLKKLIAEAESAESQIKLRRRSGSRTMFRTINEFVDIHNIKKEKDSDKSETDSIGAPNSLESESEAVKGDESLLKSTNSTAHSSPLILSQRSKGSRLSRGASPGSAIKHKVSVDMSNPAFKEPFKYGWRRELVFRATSENSVKRMADIYYYTPKGKKVRSFREVAEYLTSSNLTIDNFTFFKEPIGMDDPEKEIIRDAKRPKDSMTPLARKTFASKRSLPAKKPVEEPPATPTPPRPVGRPRGSGSGFKVKMPGKRGPQKKVKTPPEESEMLPPQWSSPVTPRRNQQPIEKTPPAKPKRALKKRQVMAETDQRQHFMVSVCAGYHALSRIFQYLKVQELLRAARVCKMWRDLAAHPALWKTVRMKNSQVTDWDGLADSLNRRGTQHLDLRKMLVAGESDCIWKKFVSVIPRVTSLLKLELCRCPVMVVEEVIKSCPQLQVLSAMSIKCDSLNLESVGNLKRCQELRLKAINGMSLKEDLSPLQDLTSLTHLSLTSVKELGKKRIEILESLTNLETLELGECSDFPEKFGTAILTKLHKLERLRLEKGQGSCCTFDILEGISRLPSLVQLELVNFDVKNGFDKCLANCKNIKRLLIIPTYISQSATSNNMVLGGVTELSNNLTHFVWGVTLELLRVTELFVDQCNQMNKQITGDSIPVLKPVPCLKLIEDVEEEETSKSDDKQPNLTNPQVDILPLPQLQKLLLTALPKTRVKILKIPFHATWRQSISDSTTQ